MTVNEFLPKPYPIAIANGSITCAAPSNIALVKYWGKKKDQIPENPSISFTLSACKTITTLHYKKKKDQDQFSFDIYLDGIPKPDFKPKIETFFRRIEMYVPFLKTYHFEIETSNTFPHSSGIASSASGMGALALCLVQLEQKLNAENAEESNYKKASFLARLGSGSACRSLEGELIVWGEHAKIEGSSDNFGTKYPYEVHEHFKDYQDVILLVDKGEKQVSSTLGHNLMHEHPYAERRFEQAHEHLSKLIDIFKTGNLDRFVAIVESEALTLHAMMMTSMPYFILMKPNTLHIINAIWKFRQNTGSKVCFTLDAGANVHLLFPKQEKDSVLKFIESDLAKFCQNGHYINDQLGLGAELLGSK
ncbi:diphosphomevalonate decarboxylase [Subsaximicrobium wynnwilliamsii]|uniref:Diphosphomevalonate decarboxylase n=1 Tax=Subsaximicrobium wynnwilliamsii TaxID=291179 RepID=A0A5C6ZDP0_9FLAO|nr:diphosphomevalonate decarboxylase [Subsaximicrobium wynnwilliamsii]TXD82365.1 diphosphomevalonate decarboxylase [Subsaximicrobium wynnwilliamsii]TXD88003.1 diphosphomevalonate decarboxylase [Subsaximicrobium wynnwilliamsii]TXE01996.1 diphosphomevalonate decarboxylase [Subsaximicrobium wynnwilliamsii]